ncbi:MAG: hypothetical protein QXJ19_07400 [Candidatus Bathyarchaeia archaeon]
MGRVLISRWHLVATAVLVGALIAKSLIFSSHVLFSPRYISDEVYYVPAGKYFMYKFGFLPEFKPPVSVTVREVGGTSIFDCIPLESEAAGIVIRASAYNWANIEHPAFAKLVYGVLICALGKLILLRLFLLAFSSVLFAFFFYTLISEYDIFGVISISVFLLLDGVVYHFTYLAFLDTLMLSLLLLSVSMFLRGNMYAAIPLALTAASKETAVVFTIPFSIFLFLRGKRRWALIYLFAVICACALSFALNMVAASPSQIVETIFGMSRIFDPYACKNICLLSLREEWGIFILYPALLWLWLAGIVIKLREEPGRETWLLPYLISLTNMAFVASASFLRSVYVFYYAPALALSPILIADLTKYFVKCPSVRKYINTVADRFRIMKIRVSEI